MGILVWYSWKKIYNEYPNFRECVCIMFHDVGYIDEVYPPKEEDNHPLLGAQICGKLFGQKYYNLCINHSRDFANKHNLKLSKLGYADKMSVIIAPIWLMKILIYLGGEFKKATPAKWGKPFDIKLFKQEYIKWYKNNSMKIGSK